MSILNDQLKQAAKHGDIAGVQDALSAGAGVHDDDNYALQIASANGHAEIVRLLCKHGATLSAIIDQLHTFSPEVQVAALTEGDLAQVDVVSLAAQDVCMAALHRLLQQQHKADLSSMLRMTQMLDRLAPEARAEQLATLLEQHDLDTRLFLATKAGDLAGVQAALAAGANVHAAADFSLQDAARKGRIEIVECLLTAGANVHANGDYAVRWACTNGHLAVAQILLAAGADIHAEDDYALALAAQYGRLEAVEWLLSVGANMNAQAGLAMKWAAQEGHEPIVRLFLARGADIQPLIEELPSIPPAIQLAAMLGGDVRDLSVTELARQGVCPAAICVLMERQGHHELSALFSATQMLESLRPEALADLLGAMLAQRPQTEPTYAGP